MYRSKIQITSCLPRAIIVGYWHLLAKEDKEKYQKLFKRICDSRGSFQTTEAHKFRSAVTIPPNRAGSIEDIPLYETFLQVSIVVLSSRIGNRKVYAGSPMYDKKIFIYHSDQGNEAHFDTITKVNAMMRKSYYCDKCDKGFKSRNGHKCSEWCNVCQKSKCKQKTVKIFPDCNKKCRSQECYIAHKTKKKSGKGKHKNKNSSTMCEQSWECLECGLTMKRENRSSNEHECGEVKCKSCNQYYLDEDQHLCYMRAFASEVNPEKFIFYDFECT